jgi:phosphonate transport system substrate-binding protein
VYHPRVLGIWDAFSTWFAERDFPIEVSPFDTYEDQVDALLEDRVDVAWNTNLAYVQTRLRVGNGCRPIAMRDTDRNWTSKVVARVDGPIGSLEDLRGRRVGFGDRDSPQAHILPVHALRAAGLDPATDLVASRLDRDVGKHGDTGGAELAQLERLRAGELDASVLSSVTLRALEVTGAAGDLREVWTSPPYDHCNFTALDRSNADHDRFRDLLLSMDAADPAVCEAMREEYVSRWVEADDSGYGHLLEAVRRGPAVVGD